MQTFSAPIPANDDSRVAALHSFEILDTPREESYDDVTMIASIICRAPFSTITLVDRDRQWFKSEVGFGTNATNRSDGICACAILQKTVMVVEDTLLDDRFSQNPFIVGGPKIRFYAGAPLVTEDGHVLGTVCVFDIVPRKLNEGQIRALQGLARQVMAQLQLRRKVLETKRVSEALRLSEKIAAVGRLASSIAHEINNPLQAVTNLLYMVDISENAGDKQKYMNQAQEELARVSHIVTQTLRFHRQSEREAPSRLTEILDSVLLLFDRRLAQADIRVQSRFRTETPLVCYGGDLRQVVANLISNAMDAARGGVLHLRVREQHGENAGQILTIADSGRGMDHETLQRLFEPFYTTKGIMGTGLGLWVSKGILDKHQATVQVKSSNRKGSSGTVFRIFFPRDIVFES